MTNKPKRLIMQSVNRKYGWKRDKSDARDIAFRLAAPVTLPVAVDLRPQCPAVYDQGELGSCTANSIAGAFEFGLLKQGLSDFMPSRLFIYYNERKMEGTIKQDSGAQIRDGIKSINAVGVCTEKLWPYNPAKFTNKPSPACYNAAKGNEATSYQKIDNTDLNALKQCLASGYPFVFGFTVFNSFESDAVAKTGIMPMPTKRDQPVGGHAVMCVGYDDEKQTFIVRNSWGDSWGDGGYFHMPYAYMTDPDLANDFWTIRIVT